MHQIEILLPQHQDTLSYETFLKKKFSSLKDNRNPADCHIVIKNESGWIAGASLVHQGFLENDPDVNDLWSVEKVDHCYRILRLWSDHPTTIPRLLKAIEKQIPADSFVYGILSVSRRFARDNESLFQTHRQIAQPRNDIQNIEFADEDFATSEGQRLIQVYKHFNAEFLGPIAASPADQTVRTLMGISMKQKNEPHFWKRYETSV